MDDDQLMGWQTQGRASLMAQALWFTDCAARARIVIIDTGTLRMLLRCVIAGFITGMNSSHTVLITYQYKLEPMDRTNRC